MNTVVRLIADLGCRAVFRIGKFARKYLGGRRRSISEHPGAAELGNFLGNGEPEGLNRQLVRK